LNQYEAQGLCVFTELRVQVNPTRFRVPDVCVTVGEPTEEILALPPHLCIEILSPEDRMSRLEARIADYLEMGVGSVWVIDPVSRQTYIATPADGLREVKTGVLTTPEPVIEVPLAVLFR
jgi:Uma2 family endonuclease